jgi:DNA-directed RNA polymerase subunit RPC12/RpoP
MGWLLKVLHGEDAVEATFAPPVPNPEYLAPPPLPTLPSHDPAAVHKRGWATKVCPSCGAKVQQLSSKTTVCESCGEPIVVHSGEDRDGKRPPVPESTSQRHKDVWREW